VTELRRLAAALPLTLALACAQSTVPTFQHKVGTSVFTLAGRDPARGGSTRIPTVLVGVKLTFDASPRVLDAAPDVPLIRNSPIFARFAFPSANAQFADAMLRATFPGAPADWHTLLDPPEVRFVSIRVPLGSGYVLTSRKSGRSLAIADLDFVQKQLFEKMPAQPGKLVIAVTHNTAFYALGDATVCCSWGTHGVDAATHNSFVLASYLGAAPSVVEDQDVQPLTQQLAQWIRDPLYDPAVRGREVAPPANVFPAWMRLSNGMEGLPAVCGGTGVSTAYFRLEPTDTNPKNNVPASKPFTAGSYHLQNVALLPWYVGSADGLGTQYSFPDPHALPDRSTPCPPRRVGQVADLLTPIPNTSPLHTHQLIGYWSGYAGRGTATPVRELSPQWDAILVAFATPDRNAPEGTLQFRTPAGFDTAQFKSDIAWLKSQGKTVMISLGGGGQHFTLADPKRVPNFVESVARIISEYGFEGIDIDFESPSLSIDAGDTDYLHPTTPSIVNLISAIRQLHDRFGPGFKISLVPEGTQIPSGYPSYGGQFGSYLPILHALRDILTFVDVQDYNTPPLLGLDGEIYQPGTVDYHAAMTELLLQGFPVGGDQSHFFPPIPANKVAVGFLTTDTTPKIVSEAMAYLITGNAPAGATYKLRKPAGYPGLIGAMFWTLDADRRANYNFSNVIGPQLHGYK